MSQTLSYSAPASVRPAARAARHPARLVASVRKLGRAAAAAAEGVSSYGVIEATVTLGTLAFATIVVAKFW